MRASSLLLAYAALVGLTLPAASSEPRPQLGALASAAERPELLFDGNRPVRPSGRVSADEGAEAPPSALGHVGLALLSPVLEPLSGAVEGASKGWEERRNVTLPFPASACDGAAQGAVGGFYAAIGAVVGFVVGVVKGLYGLAAHLGAAAGLW